jgi:acetoin utilization protein AcuC
VAHRYTEGRWLATGGGGYDAYRVVPRSWSLIWLAQNHAEPPTETDAAWRQRWEDEADRFYQSPLPQQWLDPKDLVPAEPSELAGKNARTVDTALAGALEALEERK